MIKTYLLLLLLFTSQVFASRLIIWQCVSGEINLQSDDSSLSAGSFTFELGSFLFSDGSTTPTEQNRSQWVSSWMPVDSTNYNTTNSRYTDSINFQDNTAPFSIGNQAYIWGFKGNKSDSNSEWILFTKNDWTWPNGSGPPGPPGSQLQWILNTTDIGFTAVAGELNTEGVMMRTERALPVGLTYNQWVSDNFTQAEITSGLITGFYDDPDADGFANLLEFAVGMNPRQASENGFLQIEQENQSGQRMLRIQINRVAVSESLLWELHSNPNLDTNFQQMIPQPTPTISTATQLVYEFPIQSSVTQEFYRIAVSLSQ